MVLDSARLFFKHFIYSQMHEIVETFCLWFTFHFLGFSAVSCDCLLLRWSIINFNFIRLTSAPGSFPAQVSWLSDRVAVDKVGVKGCSDLSDDAAEPPCAPGRAEKRFRHLSAGGGEEKRIVSRDKPGWRSRTAFTRRVGGWVSAAMGPVPLLARCHGDLACCRTEPRRSAAHKGHY